MKAIKYTSIWLLSLLTVIAVSFVVQRKLGWLSPTETLEILMMRISAWPLLVWVSVATLGLAAQSVRADVQNKKQRAEQPAGQQHAEQTQQQQQQQNDQQAREFAIALVGAQLTTGLFNQTKPVAYYLNPMLEQLQPYGKKPKGFFAPANGASYIYEDEPTFERKYVLYLEQLSEKLVWPFRFPALHKDYLYKGLGRIWGEPQQRIPQFITLPKAFEIKEPERVAAVEKGLRDPAMPEGIPIEEERVLRPPAWRWLWRYIGDLSAYTNYPTKEPFNEMHLQFAHAGGYDSIKNAFNYIEKNPPTKTDHPMVWTLSVDAPQFVLKETDRNANDSGTLLMWAHPSADTGRKPLVFLQRPVTRFFTESKKLSSADVGSAISEALANAQVNVGQIGHLVTDFGIATSSSAEYLSSLGEGFKLASNEPNDARLSMDLIEHRTDLTASLGDIGANTAGFSSLITAWAAFAQNKPTVLISRSAPNRIDVLVFKPRTNHVPPSHNKTYYAAVAEPEFSRPWWGERLDGKPDFGDEPNKQRADGGGLLDAAEPFEFTWK